MNFLENVPEVKQEKGRISLGLTVALEGGVGIPEAEIIAAEAEPLRTRFPDSFLFSQKGSPRPLYDALALGGLGLEKGDKVSIKIAGCGEEERKLALRVYAVLTSDSYSEIQVNKYDGQGSPGQLLVRGRQVRSSHL
jgi:hypothetical protein